MLVILFTILFCSSRAKCQMGKNMIWDKSRQNFVELYNVTGFANFQGQTPSMGRDLHAKDISGKVLRASYYEV